jgi:HEAT repeat-containing protein 5
VLIFFQGFLLSSDQYVRNIAAQALGRLCKSSGNNFTVKEIDDLIDQIISNRDPVARAGCAIALGNIYAQLGGMSASFHLKKILGVLNSLSSDPHPAVHFWALESISRVADSADLNFGPHVTGTLGLAAQLYMADTHNEEASALTASNFEVDLPTPAVVARCIDSIINVLGPDLQDATKPRDLVMALIDQFRVEEEELVLIQSLRCQEHLSLYTPGHMDFTAYVKGLQADLNSPLPQIRAMATEGLHTLMRRNADEVTKTANPGLEEQLWLVLDGHPDDEVVKNIMRNWLQQTGLSDTTTWVQRCNSVLTKIAMKAGQEPKSAAPVKLRDAPEIQDDEVAGFAGAAVGVPEDDNTTGSSTQELLKWQTRTFAMDLLSELITAVARDSSANEGSPAEAALQSRVADVVRIAFSASTAGVVSLRLRGLRIIDQVLKVCCHFRVHAFC